MSLLEPGNAEKWQRPDNEPSADKEAEDPSSEKKAEITEGSAAITEGSAAITEGSAAITEDSTAITEDSTAAEISEDSTADIKDEITEGPPAKKKAEKVFPTEKSAVQLLQEHSDKSGDEVVYEWDTVRGTPQLRFICRVRVGVEVFTGAGISKKAAKQSAAGAALEVIELHVDSALADAPKAHAFTPEGDNPITVLNHLTSLKKISTPQYELVEEQVMANRMQFTMSCRVGKVMETGSGPCKKVAKQEAALKVLEKLKRDQTQGREARYGPATHADSSRNFSEHRREVNDSRARISPYPSTTRPFQEHLRGSAPQTFNSTLERNAQYLLSEVFPNTGSTRPLMERRLDHNVEEMHRTPGYIVQGALNTGTTKPLTGNQRCQSAQQFNREPTDHSQYPPAHGSLNSGMDRPLMAHQQQGVAQELYTTPRDDAEFNMARPTLNSGTTRPRMEIPHSGTTQPRMEIPHSGTVRPLMEIPHSDTIKPLMEIPQDHGAQEKRIVSGNNALEPRFQRTLNTGTIRPLLGHPQHPSSQILNSPPGGNAQYPLAQQSLNSGISRPFQTHKQDTVVPEFHPTPKDNAQLQLARDSLNSGTIRPPMEHRGYPSNQELDVVSKNSVQYPWHQTSVNLGMIGPVQEHRQEVSAQQLNSALGQNADYKVTPLKLSSTPNQTPEQQRCTSAQELNTALGHNAGYSGAFMNPTMIKTLREHQQGPSTRGLGHNEGYMCSSLNPATVQPRNPSDQQSNKTLGNDAQYAWSSASQNTAAVASSLEQQGHLKLQESSSAPRTNGGLAFPLDTMKPTSIFGPAMAHQQESSAKQVTTQPGQNANFPLASPSPTSINPLVGLWQGAQALGFNMK